MTKSIFNHALKCVLMVVLILGNMKLPPREIEAVKTVFMRLWAKKNNQHFYVVVVLALFIHSLVLF